MRRAVVCALAISTLAVAAIVAVPTQVTAAAFTRVVLPPPVGAWYSSDADPHQPLTVTLNLRRQRDDLAALAVSVSDPSSPGYRHFRSVADIAHEYGATAETQETVRRWFADRGFTVTIDTTASFATAQIDAASATGLFGVGVFNYVDARDRSFAAAEGELTVPAGMSGAITSVGGLSNRRPEKNAAVSPAPASYYPNWPAWINRTGTPSASNCLDGNNTLNGFGRTTFTPDQLKTAYGIPDGASSAAGSRVAVVEVGEGVNPSDISTFTSCFQLPALSVQNTTVGGAQDWPTTCAAEPGLCGEAYIDVEAMATSLPANSSLYVITTTTTNPTSVFAQTAQVLSAALDPANTGGQPVSVISSSLGGCESEWPTADIDATEAVLQTAAIAGVTVVDASGDTGSTACAQSGGGPAASVQYPASSAWVTAVGGTNLRLDGSNHLIEAQVGNDSQLQYDTDPPCPTPNPCIDALQRGGGGGGVSGSGDPTFAGIPLPSWQAQAGVTTPKRAVPDVALLMEPMYAMYCSVGCDTTQWFGGGGTSAAAPLFGGMIARINQRIGGTIGLANPLLYQIARTPGANAFYDVTVGDNIIAQNDPSQVTCAQGQNGEFCEAHLYPVTCCYAAPGYDMASGWGSPKFAALSDAVVKALAPPTPIPSPTPVPSPALTPIPAPPAAVAVLALPRFTG